MHEVLVNRLGGLSLPRKSVVRLTDRPDMTLDVYRGRKTTIQKKKKIHLTIFRDIIFYTNGIHPKESQYCNQISTYTESDLKIQKFKRVILSFYYYAIFISKEVITISHPFSAPRE